MMKIITSIFNSAVRAVRPMELHSDNGQIDSVQNKKFSDSIRNIKIYPYRRHKISGHMHV